VADHEDVGLHRLDVPRRVEERLPFVTLEVAELKFTTSAERRFPAISNDVRVRVLASKKRFTTVFPRSAGLLDVAREDFLHRPGGCR